MHTDELRFKTDFPEEAFLQQSKAVVKVLVLGHYIVKKNSKDGSPTWHVIPSYFIFIFNLA